jgi:hypothetical protein
MGIDVLDMSNRELTKELINKTFQLVDDRTELLNIQRELMKAKTELKIGSNNIMKGIAANPQFKNDRARDSELAARQNESDIYKQLLTNRNLCWVKAQQQEIQIELTNNEIKNLRIMLKQ